MLGSARGVPAGSVLETALGETVGAVQGTILGDTLELYSEMNLETALVT
jgi:hypothetical protein